MLAGSGALNLARPRVPDPGGFVNLAVVGVPPMLPCVSHPAGTRPTSMNVTVKSPATGLPVDDVTGLTAVASCPLNTVNSASNFSITTPGAEAVSAVTPTNAVTASVLFLHLSAPFCARAPYKPLSSRPGRRAFRSEPTDAPATGARSGRTADGRRFTQIGTWVV